MYNGNVIKQLLLDKKVTNKELLRYLGTEANASLAQIVNGNPTVKRLEKVADFSGCRWMCSLSGRNLSRLIHQLMEIMSSSTKKKSNCWNVCLKRKIKEFYS